jgi:branched-chain amino acid transport system substrate-binding protein
MIRRTRRLFLLPVLCLLLLGCPPPEPTASDLADSPEVIRIGEYGSLTGLTATFGTSAHNGIQMAIDEVNEAGGVHGRQLRLYTQDTQSKPQEAANAVSKLIAQQNVLAIIGEIASSRTLAAAPIAQSRGVPMITPASTNPKVTEVGDFIFRVCYIDSFQGEALATFVVDELGLRRAAILKDVKNDYSVGLADFFTRSFRAKGGEIVIDQNYAEGDSDFRPQLTAIRGVGADFILIPGYYTEAGQIARQARELRITLPLIGSDGWESPRLLEIGGEALDGSYYSNAFFAGDPRPLAREFVERYRERYGDAPDALAALGYDAAKLLADAIGRAERVDRRAVRDAIARTRDFPGVTGDITIGPDRNSIKPIVILKVERGGVTLAARISPEGEVIAAPRPGSGELDEAASPE